MTLLTIIYYQLNKIFANVKKEICFGPLNKVEKVKKKKDPAKGETVCLANGLEVSKFENFKKSSQFLKEPLSTELVNEIDHFTNDAVQLLKFHGSYQQDNRENRRPGKSKDWQMMLRLRNPGGEVPGKLFLALDELLSLIHI